MKLGNAFTIIVFTLTLAVTATTLPVQRFTPINCEELIEENFSIDSYVIVDSVSARVQDEHLISAIVYQSKDLRIELITIICHFKSLDYDAIDSFERHQGNQLESLTNTTSSFLTQLLLHPHKTMNAMQSSKE